MTLQDIKDKGRNWYAAQYYKWCHSSDYRDTVNACKAEGIEITSKLLHETFRDYLMSNFL